MLAGRTGERVNNGRKPVDHRNAFDIKAVLWDVFLSTMNDKIFFETGFKKIAQAQP